MSLPNTTNGMQAADQMQQAVQESAQNVPDTQTTNTAASGSPTTQGTPDVKGSPDNAAGAPQTPQDQSQPGGQPQGQDQNQQPQQGGPKTQAAPQLPATANPNDPADHPAVQKAGVIRAIAQTLAGGPNVSYSIDANTGKMTATQQPLSKGQIGMAIAMAALSGGLSGLSEKGPGAEGRAAANAFAQGQAKQQQEEQQQKQQATQDYARAAAITQTNFQTHQNALRISQMDYDYHKQFLGDAAPVLSNINAVGAALENGVHESDLLDKYHVTKDMAIPDGIVENGKNPDGSTHWENTYTVIDPNKKIALPEDTAKLLADLRIPGYFDTDKDGKATPKNFSGSAQIRAGLVVNGLAVAQGFNITEAQLNKQFAGLKDGDKDQAEFDANLRTAISKGDVTAKGLQIIGNFAGLPIDQAVAAMQKAKVDPSIISQYQKLVPADAMEQAKQKRLADEAKAKAQTNKEILEPNKNNYDQILANPNGYSPQQVASAHQIDQQVRNEKARDAYLSGAQHEQGEIDVKKKNGIPLSGDAGSNAVSYFDDDPAIQATIKPENIGADGLNHKFISALSQKNPKIAALIEQVARGHSVPSAYGLAKKDGEMLEGAVAVATGGQYNKAQAEQYNKTMQDFRPGGNLGRALVNASTAFDHLANLNDATDAFTSGAVRGFQTIGDWLESDKAGSYATSMANAPQELGSLYANGGAAHENDVKSYRDAYHGPPAKVKSAVRQQAVNAMDKVEELANAYYSSVPGTFDKPQTFLSPKAAANYERITGLQVDPRLIQGSGGMATSNSPQGNPNTSQAARAPYRPPVGSMRKAVGNGGYIYKLPNGSVVDNYGSPVSQ